MARRRARRVKGLLPRLLAGLWRGVVWFVRHPQPLVVLAVLAAALLGVWRVVTQSEAFRITTIQLPSDSTLEAPHSLIGHNLWTVDLAAVARELQAQQPRLKHVRVIRDLPNTLRVEVAERMPVAQLRLGQWYAVAADGFILPGASAKPLAGLPVLKGLQTPKGSFKAGRENTDGHLRAALQIVSRLQRAPVLEGHQLATVDVGDARQLTFVIDDGTEIRCGSPAELAAHLERLGPVLQMVARQQLAIRYIDLRFNDPVIGPST